MIEPTHIKSSCIKGIRIPSIYYVEVTAGELTRIYEIEAASHAEAELKALEFWREDVARSAKEIERRAE